MVYHIHDSSGKEIHTHACLCGQMDSRNQGTIVGHGIVGISIPPDGMSGAGKEDPDGTG